MDTKFKPGVSGNPNGRPKGAGDKRLQYRELLNSRGEQLIDTLVNLALGGDMSAMKLCIERLVPPLKSELVTITLPEEINYESVFKVGEEVLRSLGRQNITLDEAQGMFKIIERQINMLETRELLRESNSAIEYFKKMEKEHVSRQIR